MATDYAFAIEEVSRALFRIKFGTALMNNLWGVDKVNKVSYVPADSSHPQANMVLFKGHKQLQRFSRGV
jgi:hypothetical protein